MPEDKRYRDKISSSFLSNEHAGFYGGNPLERARINAIVDTMCDIEMLISPLHLIKDPEKKVIPREDLQVKQSLKTLSESYVTSSGVVGISLATP